MRFSMLLAALVASLAFMSPVLADSQGDLNQCKFAGEVSNADESIAACDRIINDAKATAANRAIALGNRCGWWWTKKDADRALSDCNEAIKSDSRNAATYINRGNAYLLKSDLEPAFDRAMNAIRRGEVAARLSASD